jgi:hypothetical protein
MSDATDNYLRDLAPLILEQAKAVNQDGREKEDLFEKGRQMAFYEVLSLMREQAAAFGIDDRAIGLEGVDLEREFLKTGRSKT